MKYFLLLFITANTFAQTIEEINTDTLNKINAKGKREGYWVELVNEKLNPVRCRKKAKFFRFIYYDNGVGVDNWKREFVLEKINLIIQGNRPNYNNIIMLNGMYEIYKKKQLLFSEEYCNGKKCGYVSYNLKTGKILEKADYTKKFDQQEHSFYLMFDENEKGEFTSTAYFRKGKRGWGVYYEK